MTDRWNDVDDYLDTVFSLRDEALQSGLARAEAAGLPAIQVTAAQGKFLHLLARMISARRILEIGTLGGYSTTWLARALPAGGQLVTLEVSPENADVARTNIAEAGLDEVVQIRIGAALDSLPEIESQQLAPFDLVFIDADKPNNPEYVRWALRLTRPGSVIVLDNVVRDGQVIDPNGDPAVQGTRAALDLLGSDPRIDATAIQTVGNKGYDGFAIGLVVG
jgi:predicted O-methyltransferase YrrM